jgi:small subunit ribosomal protein S6
MSARTYELIYVLKPDAPEQEVNSLHAQVVDVVDRMGGKIEKTDQWGRRKLAYEIGHHKEGFYVLELISGTGELMKELDRRLRVTEGLLRHLIVRVDESTIKADRARTKRTEESRRRRVARGLPPDRQPGEGPQGMDDDDAGDMMFDGADMEER